MEEQKKFGWDDEIENEGGQFTLFEPGIYKFTVTKFERERYQGGEKIPACNCADLELEITDESGHTTTVLERLFLIEKMEWKLCQFFTALGLRKKGERFRMQFDKILGRSGMAKVIVNRYKDKKTGEDRENNKIDTYLDPEDYPLPAQKSAQNSWKNGTW